MDWRYLDEITSLDEAVLAGDGKSACALRRAVEAAAARTAGVDRADVGTMADALKAYVQKVAKHAYKVTDEDVERLVAAGYDEDVIFELTVSAALGAGLSRLERGLLALRGRIA